MYLILCFSIAENNTEMEDLLDYFQQQLSMKDSSPKICSPESEMTQMHISGTFILFINLSFIFRLKPNFIGPDVFLSLILNSCVFNCSLASRGSDVHIPLGRVQ